MHGLHQAEKSVSELDYGMTAQYSDLCKWIEI